MIEGIVTAEHEAKVEILVQGMNGQDYPFDVIVDTGFTGCLTLPPQVIKALQLPWREWGEAILADGSEITYHVNDASVHWDGQMITIPVDEADSPPLLGMRLMQGYWILIEDIDGGSVRLERL